MMSVIIELIASAKGCKKGRAKGRIGTIESERDKRSDSPHLWKLVWCSCGLRNRGESKELHSLVISLTHKLLAISRLCWSRVGNTRSLLPSRHVPASPAVLPMLLCTCVGHSKFLPRGNDVRKMQRRDITRFTNINKILIVTFCYFEMFFFFFTYYL